MISQKIIRLSCSFLIIIFATLFVHQTVMSEENQSRSVAEMIEEQESPPEEVNAEPLEQEETPLMEQDNPFFLLLKMVFYLFVVIILIYGLIKFLSIRHRKMQNNQLFQSLGGTTLGQNKSLQLVRVGGQLYLLGVADQITLIKEIADTTQISKIEGDLEKQDQIVSNSFIEYFQTKFKEKAKHGSTPSFSSLFNQSLQQQKEKRNQLENELYSYKTDEKEGRSK